MKKFLIRSFKIIIVAYVLVCGLMYSCQEKLIFFPEKLDKNYKFQFRQHFEEKNILTPEGIKLNCLLFKADSSKGVIFYLHGNGGSLSGWGNVAKNYTDLHYDLFIVDYPGYGKSEGKIHGQQKLYDNLQTVYDDVKTIYPENKIIVLGYSIGTGPAAKLASTNHPKMLILQAPYYSLKDLVKHIYPVVPSFLLKYKFQTNEYLPNCKMPVVIFHGDADRTIYYESSIKLKQSFKKGDTLITLKGFDHNGMTDNPDYSGAIKTILLK
jgi:pimeloyl-ACP methyl ester carboxylesterase